VLWSFSDSALQPDAIFVLGHGNYTLVDYLLLLEGNTMKSIITAALKTHANFELAIKFFFKNTFHQL